MNFFLVILIFDRSNLCTDICKTIFVILEVQFHHEGGLSETCYLELFSRHGLYFHHAKNQPPLGPPSTFSEHWPWFWQYLLSGKFTKKIWYKIWVITISKSAKFLAWEVYWKRNKSLLLTFFLTFKTPLPYSAVSRSVTQWLTRSPIELSVDS